MALTVETRSWPEIVEFYRRLVTDSGCEFGPMLELVESLATSPYSADLFPATSLARLCMARTRTIRWSHAMLAVEYDPVGERFVFEYFEAASNPKPWVTTCPASDGRAWIERLLKKRLRWFRDTRPASNA